HVQETHAITPQFLPACRSNRLAHPDPLGLLGCAVCSCCLRKRIRGGVPALREMPRRQAVVGRQLVTRQYGSLNVGCSLCHASLPLDVAACAVGIPQSKARGSPERMYVPVLIPARASDGPEKTIVAHRAV